MQGFSKGVNGKKLVLQETSRTWLMKLLEESLFGKSGTEERSLSELFWQDDPQKMLDSCKCNNKPVACDFPHLLGKLMNAWDFDLTDCPVKRNGSRKAFCESEYERFVFCYDLAEAYELLPIDTSLNKKEKYDKVKSMMATFSRKQRK
jgi:hypothetical protein